MKQTITLALLAGANILITLLFQWYVITQLGVGVETDALFAGMAVPQLVLIVVSSSLTHVLVPLLAGEKDDKTFRHDSWAFFLGISAFFTLLTLALYVTASVWVRWLVHGFSGEAIRLAITLSRIQLVSMAFIASVSVLWSIYHARQRFVWVELSALLSNALALALLAVVLPVYGVTGAALLIVLRSGLQVLLLLPGMGAWQWPDWNSFAVRSAWRRIRPLLLGTTYFRTDPLVDRYLTSSAPTGVLSILYIAQQIYGVTNLLAERAVAAPMMPLLAIAAREQRWREFRRIYTRRLLSMFLWTLSGYGLLLLVGEKVLNLLIGHGGVTAANVHLLWLTMLALAGFFFAGAMGVVTSKTFYAMGDTSTPTRLTAISYTLYIPVKIIVFYWYGLLGLAIVISVYLFVNLAIQMLLLDLYVLPKRERQ